MIKIAALNEESEEESDSEGEVTREALEQIALQQYAKALDLQRKGNLSDAMQLLNDLLETELLYDVKKPAPGEKSKEPLFNLKYLCYKNVASMRSSVGDNEKAIEAYTAATELDDTDVTLWHRFGLTCIKAEEYEKALYAFQQGTQCNPRHWPCIDKIVTLQLALGYYSDCIETIYKGLELDPGYLRGLAYRKHIYSTYHYVRDFLTYLKPEYVWKENEGDEPLDDVKCMMLLKEAEDIHVKHIKQINEDTFNYVIPQLSLKKPITNLTWQAVGESLVHMHNFMTENCYSYACIINMNYEKPNEGEPMEVCEEPAAPTEEDNIQNIPKEVPEKKTDENTMEVVVEDKNMDIISDDNNELSDKATTDNEKVEESDMEVPAVESTSEVEAQSEPQTMESKESNKKSSSRRRGSALSFLQQWEWYTKRRSGRKKPINKQDRDDENIYDTLRRMVPEWLVPDNNKETTIDITTTETTDPNTLVESDKINDCNYFGSEAEQNDVKNFIQKYTLKKCDIIEILKEYLYILSQKWKLTWDSGFWKTYVEANECYSNHIDIPSCCENNKDEIIHYTFVNILCEEFQIGEKLKTHTGDMHELNIIENIGIILNNKPDIYGSDCFELMLRYLWVKLHTYLFNKFEDLALDCLYRLLYEFESMGEHHDSYSLELANFKFKPLIKESEVLNYINFLERNNKLSTVLELFDNGLYEDVLTIVTDSFQYTKNNPRSNEEEMSLDYAAQLCLIIDCCWELKKVEDCVKWSTICLHEALKYYFQAKSGSPEQKKWSVAILKILTGLEHILATEGLLCLEGVSQKELSNTLEDLIRIIGHQVDTNTSEMAFGTISPWVIMHYILQREDDQGRSRKFEEKDSVCDEIPNPIMVLFIAHEQLGNHSWCANYDSKLLYFILDTVVPRLRAPSLSPSLEQIMQHLEQCVFCLFGHPGKKTKLKYLIDHKVTPHSLDWSRAQQIYEIFKPSTMPELEGKVPSITTETEQLFHRILAILPPDCEPHKYVAEMEEYLNGKRDKLPEVPTLLPFKLKDIYFLLGDYYFKKEERKRSVKFNVFDVIINNNRFESWAEIGLAKGVNLELKLNSCANLDNDKDYLDPAKVVIRCFKRALELDRMSVNLWVEYGAFVYSVYSFCSRVLKHASESLSMQDFESLEQQKEAMLDQTQKCFTTIIQERLIHNSDENDELWLHYYMMGKVAEKRNKHPSVYLNLYAKAVKSLKEADATYPAKINYNTPQHLSIEVLEIHYRIHASILKYIEQHENKPIPVSVGKVFLNSIKQWKSGPFTKKPKKDDAVVSENETKSLEAAVSTHTGQHAGNILKRSISDAGEDDNHELKRQKLESAAAKVRRSASYDTEPITTESITTNGVSKSLSDNIPLPTEIQNESKGQTTNGLDTRESNIQNVNKTNGEVDKNDTKLVQINGETNEDTVSATSTSSDSSSDDTTSDSTTSTSRDTDISNKTVEDNPMSDNEIMEVICACLDALEDCCSRLPQNYKSIYRLAHYHFYYKKGKDIERCRDLMLSNFTSRANQKLGGLFNERKQTNFFNGVWRIPSGDVDRPGGFSYHMNRCVLLTMEILKEIDDHKTLLELSMHLQRVPDPDKKYLREVDREDLAQQAFLLCVQSLKGQLLKFSQQTDLRSNEVEKQAFNSLMLDIYRAYTKVQKQPNSKQLVNLLIDGYKLVCTMPIIENTNLTDISMKYCQSLIAALKQKATLASIDKNNQNAQKKQAAAAKAAAAAAATVSSTTAATSHSDLTKTMSQSKQEKSSLMSSKDMAAAFMQSYLPLVSPQTAAAMLLYGGYDNYSLPTGTQASMQNPLSSNLPVSIQSALSSSLPASMQNALSSSLPVSLQNAITNNLQTSFQSSISNVQSTLKNLQSLQNPLAPLQSSFPSILPPGNISNSYQSEYYRQLLSLSKYNVSPPKKQKSKTTSSRSNNQGAQTTSKPYSNSGTSSYGSHSRGIPSTATTKLSNLSSTYTSQSKSNPGTTSNISAYSSSGRTGASAFASQNKMGSLSNAFSTGYNQSRSSSSINVSSSRNFSNKSTLPSMSSKNNFSFPINITNPLSSTAKPAHMANSFSSTAKPAHMANSFSSTAKPAHMASSLQNVHKGTASLQAHMSSSSVLNPSLHSKPASQMTLQQKLAERQKNSRPSVQEINASLNKLPSSLTVTKTNVTKKPEVMKPKPVISSDEVIVLDDDD